MEFQDGYKNKLIELLKYKNHCWRKRLTANRIKLGDECTKNFHAMATVSYRKNIHQCHKSKREIIILKLDFTKAFDTVEHSLIIDVMIQMCFSEK